MDFLDDENYDEIVGFLSFKFSSGLLTKITNNEEDKMKDEEELNEEEKEERGLPKHLPRCYGRFKRKKLMLQQLSRRIRLSCLLCLCVGLQLAH